MRWTMRSFSSSPGLAGMTLGVVCEQHETVSMRIAKTEIRLMYRFIGNILEVTELMGYRDIKFFR